MSSLIGRPKYSDSVPARRSFCVANGRLSCGSASLMRFLSHVIKALCLANSRAIAARGSAVTRRNQSPSNSRDGLASAATSCGALAGGALAGVALAGAMLGPAGCGATAAWDGRADAVAVVICGARVVAGPASRTGSLPLLGANASKRKNVIINAVCSSGARRKSSRPCNAIW